ncbi:MAG TPA: carbamate kinase [bacterium]|nr:carbamate kinase [bacterium]
MCSTNSKFPRIAVVALGGNAITREFEEGNIYQQFANTRRSLVGVVDLISQGVSVIITHGNGPQVGNALIRVEEARHLVPPIPLGVLVADTEGGMGYMIEQSLQNMLHRKGISRQVATLLTQVIVDKNDPSIMNPTKFVGPFFREDQLEAIRKERGWAVRKDADRGWRRVVPSPRPVEIVERRIIQKLVSDGTVVIACGGGGIPVYVEEDGAYEGVDGVVDKDRASAVLGLNIGAQELYILTAVEKVALNFGTSRQRDLDRMTLAQAAEYLEAGEFPPGNMGPKIEAAIEFLEGGGEEVIITSMGKMAEALHGGTGTRIVPA